MINLLDEPANGQIGPDRIRILRNHGFKRDYDVYECCEFWTDGKREISNDDVEACTVPDLFRLLGYGW